MAIPERTRTVWKAVADSEPFGWDWGDKLAELGDTIGSVVETPTGVSITGETHTDTVSTFRATGGTVGAAAEVVTAITTTTYGYVLTAQTIFVIT